MTGETIATSNFSTFGRGTITFDPLNQQNIEFASFTAVDATNIALTGGIRGLSALSNTASTTRAKYHSATTPVIITFGVHSISDILAYINNAVSGSLGTATDTTAGSTKMSLNQGSLPRARSTLVSQQASPNMTLAVQPFARAYRGGVINYAGGNTTTMVAPVSNPRYDLVVYSTASSAVAVRTGTEGVSPTRPTPTAGDIVLCDVYHRVGETTLLERDVSPNTQGYITIWYESDTYNSSSVITTDSVTNGSYDQSQTTSNGTQAVGQSNVTTKASIIAEKFVPTISGIAGVSLWKIADTGSFTGTVKVSLQADSSGNPSGTDLASYTISNANWLLLNAAAEFNVIFSTEYETLVDGSPYWIVVTPSTSDTSNHPNLGINTAGGYASGLLKYNNSADGWVTVATSILYFKENEGVVSKIIKTDTSGLTPFSLSRYGLVYVSTANVNNGQATTDTVLGSVQIPAGWFTTTSGIKVNVSGTFTARTSSADSLTLKVRLNGNSFISVVASPGAGATNNSFVLFNTTIFIQNSGALNTQNVYAYSSGSYFQGGATTTIVQLNNNINNPTTSGIFPINTTSAVDTSAAGILSVTYACANSSDIFYGGQFSIEKLG